MATEITAIRNIEADYLWSVREDLQSRFAGIVAAEMIDDVLDYVASNRSARVTAFSKIFIEREAAEALVSLAGTRGELSLAA
ncbi:three-helix bundle dimerization domain-containing protein [Corynebacterium pacaense]|uniref:three-helix bundle dimerization domain-containing protein n=1 Tax=Corynebacterium pacaense TaxID=1816684 RepID=UPI0011780545|nr:hypothetical protein [Corynebacterium pacaense]